MFWNLLRRIKDLEFEIESKDRTIENLKNEIKESKSTEYHPNVTCVDCEYCIVEEQINYRGYYCRLNNDCEDYTLKE